MSRIYSPSQTEEWSRCPALWDQRKRWEPLSGTWSPERLIGLGVHAALEKWWGRIPSVDAAQVARDYVVNLWPADAPDVFSVDGAASRAGKAAATAVKWFETEMAEASPLLIEHSFGESIVDLVTQEGDLLVVNDYKYVHELPGDRVHYRLDAFPRKHQFWHYVWRTGEHYMRPVDLFRGVLIIGGPKMMVKHTTFAPSPEGIAAWHKSAQAKWAMMEAMAGGTLGIPRREEGCSMYGDKYPCPMAEGCWTLNRNEAGYDAIYNRRTHRR